MKKVWKLRPPSLHTAQLAREAGISPLQAQLLINRGISEAESANSFLMPRLSSLRHPMLLKDMAAAVQIILKAIEKQEPILVYGDYDADGITATALLLNFFSSIDILVSSYIPNRLTEGYGLNATAVERIAERGVKLLITVDCGTTSRKEIDLAKRLGMNIVVTDHHRVPEDFEPICPVINPHRSDSSFPFRDLAGVGLAFYLASALRAALRETGWFRHRREPDLRDYLDLVGLGTVADMAPLLEENRTLVKSATERVKDSCWPGLRAIQEVAGLGSTDITPHDLAFRVAPRLNAAGRLGSAEAGLHLLITKDPSTARDLANRLNALNSERQCIEQEILDHIDGILASMEDLDHRRTLVLSGNDWHRGVLGIVASRLVERYHRPVLVSSIEGDMAMGSGRSIEGFDLYQALGRIEHLFERFGGHHHAVGFALEVTNMALMVREFEDLAQKTLSEEDLVPTVEIDMEMTLPDITLETVRAIETLSPFGPGNPEPTFFSHSLEVVESRIVGENHLKLRVKQEGHVMEAIGFGLSGRQPLRGQMIRTVFTLERDRWQGYERIQLKMIDLEPMDHSS